VPLLLLLLLLLRTSPSLLLFVRSVALVFLNHHGEHAEGSFLAHRPRGARCH
jgi:hypothetical protein